MLVEPEVVDRILSLGRQRPDREIGGLLFPHDGPPSARVVWLKNSALEPEDSCLISAAELERGIRRWTRRLERAGHPAPDLSQTVVAVWHTHPSGHAGPSKMDLQTKPACPALVVALPDGPAVIY